MTLFSGSNILSMFHKLPAILFLRSPCWELGFRTSVSTSYVTEKYHTGNFFPFSILSTETPTLSPVVQVKEDKNCASRITWLYWKAMAAVWEAVQNILVFSPLSLPLKMRRKFFSYKEITSHMWPNKQDS